jgi:hypothetical protein
LPYLFILGKPRKNGGCILLVKDVNYGMWVEDITSSVVASGCKPPTALFLFLNFVRITGDSSRINISFL